MSAQVPVVSVLFCMFDICHKILVPHFTSLRKYHRVHSMEFKILQLLTPTEFPVSPLMTLLHTSYYSETKLLSIPQMCFRPAGLCPRCYPHMLVPCLMNPDFCEDLLKCPFFGSLLPVSLSLLTLPPQLLAAWGSGKGMHGL